MPSIMSPIMALLRYKLKERELKNQPEKAKKELAKMQKDIEVARERRQIEIKLNSDKKGFNPDVYNSILINQDKLEIERSRLRMNRRKVLATITNLYDKKILENTYKKGKKSEKSDLVSDKKPLDVEHATNVASYFARINWKGTQEEYEAHIDKAVKKKDQKALQEWTEYHLASRQDNKILAQAKLLDKKQTNIKNSKLGICPTNPNAFISTAMALPNATDKTKKKSPLTRALFGGAGIVGIADAVAIALKLKSKEASSHFVDSNVLQEILNSEEYKEKVADLKEQAEQQIENIQSLTEEQVALLNGQINEITSSLPNAQTILDLKTEIADLQAQISEIDSYYEQLKQEQATHVTDLLNSEAWTGTQEEYVRYVSNLSSSVKMGEYYDAVHADEEIISNINEIQSNNEDYDMMDYNLYLDNLRLNEQLKLVDDSSQDKISDLQGQIDELYASVETERADTWADYQTDVDGLLDQYLNQEGQKTDTNVLDNLTDLMMTDQLVMGLTIGTAAAAVIGAANAVYSKSKHKNDIDPPESSPAP